MDNKTLFTVMIITLPILMVNLTVLRKFSVQKNDKKELKAAFFLYFICF